MANELYWGLVNEGKVLSCLLDLKPGFPSSEVLHASALYLSYKYSSVPFKKRS